MRVVIMGTNTLGLIKIAFFVIAAWILLVIPVHAESEEFDGIRAQRKKYEAGYLKHTKGKNQKILFYGLVADFDGEPVIGAKVLFDIRYYPQVFNASDFRKRQVLTDNQGRFVVEDSGELLSLKDIEKSGYQYRFQYNQERLFNFTRDMKHIKHGLEPENPMVFRVLKLEQPSFAFPGSIGFKLKKDESKLLDLFKREWVSSDRVRGYNMISPDWKADIKVCVEEVGENYQVIFETLEPGSGFVEEAPEFLEEMTEAPEHGYRPKLVIPLKRGGSGHLFTYVKSSGGLFYSKMSVSYFNGKERDYVGLRFGHITNMEGGRGLEYKDELYRQYLHDVRSGHRKQALREQLLMGKTVAPFVEEAK